MIKVEGYRAFRGTMRIIPVGNRAPFQITCDWLYKPDMKCWYGNGESFDEEICEVIDDGTSDLCRVAEYDKAREEEVQ